MSESLWQFWIDVGGTFTDCVARRPDGVLLRHKRLSSGVTKGALADGSDRSVIRDPARRNDPEDFWRGCALRLLSPGGQTIDEASVRNFERSTGALALESPLASPPSPGAVYELVPSEEAPLLCIRQLLGLPLGQPIPPVSVRLGTTRGTNALLTREGAKTAFVTTKGFGDILDIGYQDRPHLFELDICKPLPLCSAVLEIAERVAADGEVLVALEPLQVRRALQELRENGIESLAICLLHADRYPQHETQVEGLAREVGFREVSRSSQVAPVVKIVARGDTTVVDAYLNPVLRSYFQRLRDGLAAQPGGALRVLTSAGGLVRSDHFRGKDSILSGPAGGVVGFSRVAEAVGFERAIGLDMGGTSTDVSRFDGRFELEYETKKAGVRVVAPMLAIETVAAGGGSVCWFDGIKLAVGPASAGADPGPACYGRGGPLALTDVNYYLGRILDDEFPFQLDRGAVQEQLETLGRKVTQVTRQTMRLTELADGFLQVANRNMAHAIRSISVAKGYDPEEYLLVAFGGAAPQHACAIADQLQIRRILIHPDASVLSAYGVGMADVRRHSVAGVYARFDTLPADRLRRTFQHLAAAVQEEIIAEGVPEDRLDVHYSLDLRYQGTDAALTVAEPSDGDFAAAFLAAHRRLYGYVHEGRPLEVVTARVEAVGRSTTRLPASRPHEPRRKATCQRTTRAFFAGEERAAEVYRRAALQPGDCLFGPAIVLEPMSTTVVESGWKGEVFGGGELMLERETRDRRPGRVPARVARISNPQTADPVMLEIFNGHFAGIAEQMGIVLRNTASSVNVKERLDFSCALFTSDGDLVVNAPHIPVHLGAMAQTVKRVIADNEDLVPDDVIVTNDPYRGGSHLPDVTVVTPVHDQFGRLRFFTASRAHHAEIGGITPGSMPPFSTNLGEEGVLIRNFRAVAAGRSRLAELRAHLLDGPHPTRDADTNLADISAQIAANRLGARELLQLVETYGWELVEANMRFIQAAAERQVRRALRRLADGRYEFTDHLDDGTPIVATISIRGDAAWLDFTGTGPVQSGNLNANPAIVTAAVMYCLRCLLDEPIPLNQGVLAPIRMTLPECLLNPSPGERAAHGPAVAGGNVETSQRVVDVLLGALAAAAASQGTMNNVLFGDASFGYYETICGGAGATASRAGADAVHTHMTNTRLTDPEVLEQRFPVRVREFSIRRGSGGRGKHRGGDGVVRRLEFLRDLELSILSQRRGPYPPYGLRGGEPGALGINELRRADGRLEPLAGNVQVAVHPGDVLTVKTPGGGGFGAARELPP